MILRWMFACLGIAALCVLLARLMPAVERPNDGPWRRAAARLRSDRSAMLGLRTVVALLLLALLAPLLAPYDPIHQPDIVALESLAPSVAHPFGTDQYSRDVLSRVL